MWKARFCHSTSLYKIGNEAVLQAPLTTPLLGFGVLSGWPGGQVMLAGSDARNSAVCPAAETPAGWGVDKGTQRTLAPIKSRGQGVGALASGAKKAPNSDPDDAVESLDTMVLLIRFTPIESNDSTASSGSLFGAFFAPEA